MSDVSSPKWLDSPPKTALAESLLMSGLVSEKYVVKTKHASPERPQHVAIPMTGKPRRLPPKTAYRSAPPEKVKVLPQIGIDDFAVPARNIEIPLDYKPPPIEHTSENRRYFETPKRHFEERRFASTLGDLQQRDSRTKVRQLRAELDAAIANVGVDALTENGKESEQNTKLLNTYNYVFNQLILQEKERDSERAVLMRRLQQFFTEQVELAPIVRGEMSEVVEKMKAEQARLQQKLEAEEAAKQAVVEKVESVNEDVKKLQEKLDKTTEESNKKDIILDSNKFDLESLRGKVAFLQLKIKKKKEKCGKLKGEVKEAVEQNKRVAEQLESASETVEKYRRQEVGYIPQYQEELKRANALEDRVKQLEAELESIRNVSRMDMAVETDDSLVLGRKTKKSGRLKAKRMRPLGMSLETITISDFDSSISLTELQAERKKFAVTAKSDAETQTETVEETKPDKVQQKEDNGIMGMQFQMPSDYPYSDADILRIPDMLPMLIPVLAGPMAKATPNIAPVVFSLSYFDKVQKQKKPLVWGIQLIHSFLMDAFLRAESFELENMESVFMEWLNVQYKLPHLTRQVAADMAYFLAYYIRQDKYVDLFNSILIGQYTHAQVVFMATVYSFTINLTYPSYLGMVEKLDEAETDSRFDKVQIHIKVVYQIIASAFTKTMADKYIEGKVDPEKPFINYIDFLRDMAVYFSQRHKVLYQQTRDLLTLCGCLDVTKVHFEPFASFLVFVGEGKNAKYHWENIQMNKKERKDFLPIGNIMSLCVTKKAPMIQLLSTFSLSPAISILHDYNEISRELFKQFLTRFTGQLSETLWRLPEAMYHEVESDVEHLKIAFMHADLQRVLWFYRMILIRVDRMLMEDHGSIPYPSDPTRKTVNQLIEYFDRTESVAFALINI